MNDADSKDFKNIELRHEAEMDFDTPEDAQAFFNLEAGDKEWLISKVKEQDRLISKVKEQDREIERLRDMYQVHLKAREKAEAELSACKERVRELEETLFKIKRDSLEPDKIYIHLSRALGPALEAQEQREE